MSEAKREWVVASKAGVPQEDLADVLAVLDDYGSEPYHREKERVQLAVLRLSRWRHEPLRDLMDTARADYRDVLMAAEYWREPNLPQDGPEGRPSNTRGGPARVPRWLYSTEQ
jgi:hypothetical protein